MTQLIKTAFVAIGGGAMIGGVCVQLLMHYGIGGERAVLMAMFAGGMWFGNLLRDMISDIRIWQR